MQLTKRAFLLSGAALAVSAASGAFAMGTPSGFAVVGFAKQGDLGEVIVIPYKISPLTAVIKNGGYELLTAHVRVVPKDGGQEIAYDVSKAQLLTHAGIPVFGLYADYSNKVEVKYSYRFDGKEVKGEHTYTIVSTLSTTSAMPTALIRAQSGTIRKAALSRGASFRRLPSLTRRAPFAGTSTLRRFGIPNRSTPRAS